MMRKSVFFIMLFFSFSFPVLLEAKYVNLDEFKKGIIEQNKHLTVGFDIDDTILFSSPSFYYYRNKYKCYRWSDCSAIEQFWFDINNVGDHFSLPKKIAYDLINFHRNRGDVVYFITARQKTSSEKLTDIIRKTFDFPEAEDVIFTGSAKKDFALSEYKIDLYYGDSDDDIKSAIRVKARPVRILRAGNSINDNPFNPGEFGEEIIKNSEL